MADAENPPNNNPPMPTEAEIINLIRQGKGVANLWSTLRAKYGPAKGSYGAFVYLILTRHNKPIQSADNHPTHNPTNNDVDHDAATGPKLSTNSEPSGDAPYPLSNQEYLEIVVQLFDLHNQLLLLGSSVARLQQARAC